MRKSSRRLLVFTILVAVAIGFALGWFGRIWSQPSPEERARQQMEELKERARSLTH